MVGMRHVHECSVKHSGLAGRRMPESMTLDNILKIWFRDDPISIGRKELFSLLTVIYIRKLPKTTIGYY